MIFCEYEKCVNYNKMHMVGTSMVSTCAFCTEMKKKDLCTCDKEKKVPKAAKKKPFPKKGK